MVDVAKILRRYEKEKSVKEPWNTHYQIVGKYIRHRKQNFTMQHTEGDFLTEEIFDTTACEANERFASALLGNIWPSGAKTVKILPSEEIPNNKMTKEYFEWLNRKLTDYMDEPRAALSIALKEFSEDLGSFGVCGLGIFDNKDVTHPLSYAVWDIKKMVIGENQDGFVDYVGAEFQYTVEEAVDEYGLDKLSSKVGEAYAKGDYKCKVNILKIIQPRDQYDPNKKGNKDMPIAVYHIETESGNLISESGFIEMPVLVSRLSKAAGEKYGRSPAIDGLPSIILANSMNEAILRAVEKQLDPPMGLLNDGTLGNEEIDTSAGGLTVFNVSGRTPIDKPIFPLQTVGDMTGVAEYIKTLQDQIWKKYKLDLLLDLNNQTRMTLGEAQIRNRIRSEGISSMFVRQETELLNPLIIRSFNILFEKGLLGIPEGDNRENELRKQGVEIKYIPAEIVQRIQQGLDIYKIKYISPAKRIMDAEELQGLLTSADFITTHAQTFPDMVLKIDPEVLANKVVELTGASPAVVRDSKTYKDLIASRNQMQQAQMNQEAAKNMAGAMQNVAQAQATTKGAEQIG